MKTDLLLIDKCLKNSKIPSELNYEIKYLDPSYLINIKEKNY
jgi:hypothetical protein